MVSARFARLRFAPLRFAACLLGLAAVALPGAAQAQPCANEFMPLRATVEKEGALVKAAIDKKDRGEICSTLKRFTASEAKFLKYMTDNQSWCGIPPDIIDQLKKSHANSTRLRGQACAAGPGPAARAPLPAGPGLSEALGTSRGPIGAQRSGTGTFDTLTGPTIR